MPSGPRFAGSNLAKSDGFLREVEMCSMMSFGGEAKPAAPCHKILWHVKDPLRYDRDPDRQNPAAISHSFSPCFTTRCVCCNQSKELWWMNWE
jgi:hypothetical protein